MTYELRKPGNWRGERELYTHYRDGRIGDLVNLFNLYQKYAITYQHLLQQVPAQTRWLRSSRRQMERINGQEDVLLVLGWCPLKDAVVRLDAETGEMCFTEQLDCRRNAADNGCEGNYTNKTPNLINFIALMTELTVATKQYDIKFSGVWGFSKLFAQLLDTDVFPRLPFLANVPRKFCCFHISRIYDPKSPDVRKVLCLNVLESLASVVEMDPYFLYEEMRKWFESEGESDARVRFRLLPITDEVQLPEEKYLLGNDLDILLEEAPRPPSPPPMHFWKPAPSSPPQKIPLLYRPRYPLRGPPQKLYRRGARDLR
ncbi:hypothetical protein BP5796_07324 [Coleophoma crateriformis]|uniref:Uncharacterized protein n=1 Tax=Coleophoma crateriformis TaxID=565419 RepID=A0A3D8RIK3_9HELO|nr:hypothetical protein BP5796_07324 [Coleophoma crateriformis]